MNLKNSNSFIELVVQRQSVRRYSSKKVEKDKIDLCLEAARLAPSASNSQPWHFIITDEPVLKEEVAKETYDSLLTFNKFVPQAPVILVIVLEKPKLITRIGSRIKKIEYPLIDIGIAAEHFCLQAAELGLGTCMIGWFNEKPIKKLLSIPRSKSIGLLISLGYPEEGYKLREKSRKSRGEVISYNSYQ